jgi:hypothetical protein
MFVVQRSNQKEFGFSVMFNNQFFQVYIEQEFEFRASRHLKLVSVIAARQPGDDISSDTTHS